MLIAMLVSTTYPAISQAVILQGTTDGLTPPDTKLSGVGIMHTGTSLCTAQAIARNLLITAAHCTNSKTLTDGSFLWDLNGDGVGEGSRSFDSYVDHPQWANDGRQSRPTADYSHDLALITLSSPLPNDVPIYKIAPYVQIPVGASVTISGYGVQGIAGYERSNFDDGVWDRRVATNVIDSNFSGQNNIFQMDFTNKEKLNYVSPCSGKGCLFIDKAVGFGFQEGITDSGDSGGGVFLSAAQDYQYRFPNGDGPLSGLNSKLLDPTLYIIGINSHGPSSTTNYGHVTGHVFLGSHIDWIKSIVPDFNNISASESSNSLYSAAENRDFGTVESTFELPEFPTDIIPPTSTPANEPNLIISNTHNTANPLTLNFDDTALMSTSTQMLTITNNGNLDLIIGQIATNDPLAMPFSITEDTCSNTIIPENSTCTLSIQFKPPSETSFSDTFDIPSNDPEDGTVIIITSGDGIYTQPSVVNSDNETTANGNSGAIDIWILISFTLVSLFVNVASRQLRYCLSSRSNSLSN